MTVLNAFPPQSSNTDPTRDSVKRPGNGRVCRMVCKSTLMLIGLNHDIVSGDRGTGMNLRDSFKDPQYRGHWL